jgi:hypothetical protein
MDGWPVNTSTEGWLKGCVLNLHANMEGPL